MPTIAPTDDNSSPARIWPQILGVLNLASFTGDCPYTDDIDVTRQTGRGQKRCLQGVNPQLVFWWEELRRAATQKRGVSYDQDPPIQLFVGHLIRKIDSLCCFQASR